MSDNPKHVTVRLRVPPELRDKIAESAKEHKRSMNADMVARLEESFKKQNNFKISSFVPDELHDLIQQSIDENFKKIEYKLKIIRNSNHTSSIQGEIFDNDVPEEDITIDLFEDEEKSIKKTNKK